MAAYLDQFSAEALLVIKKPPEAAPTIVPFTTATENNFLEERAIDTNMQMVSFLQLLNLAILLLHQQVLGLAPEVFLMMEC